MFYSDLPPLVCLLCVTVRTVNADQNLFGVQEILMLVIWRTTSFRSAATIVNISVIHIWNKAPVALKSKDTILRKEILRSENGLLKMDARFFYVLKEDY